MNHGFYQGDRSRLGAYFDVRSVPSMSLTISLFFFFPRQIHQIQSGQVIVDLCSVAKELVENSLDAGATSIGEFVRVSAVQEKVLWLTNARNDADVRFKNNGMDLIEVQDNGNGIPQDSYESVGECKSQLSVFFETPKVAANFHCFIYLALKHHTSKLSSFEGLSELQTFGFRGEALSSLCALSDFRMMTAQAGQAPKANKLEFEKSGKLKSVQVVAGQKGTTASVGTLFKGLPVRQRELEKNIKREYTKVLNLLHAYACISTGVRFSVRNTVGKKQNVVVFATNGNQTTRENIANVYGAKTLSALIPLELELEFEPSARRTGTDEPNKIFVSGHTSRPVFGEGRQTPDRQMFFVNSRPCSLPQIARAFNEIYKSYNIAQSPFIFADFHMDTNAYDVNVSPDKRTVLLHDAAALIMSLKEKLTQLFERTEQTVPQSQILGSKQSTVTAKQQHDGEGRSPTENEEEPSQSSQARSRFHSLLSGSAKGNLRATELSSSSPTRGSLSNQDNTLESSPTVSDQTSEEAEENVEELSSSRLSSRLAESGPPSSSKPTEQASTSNDQRILSFETTAATITPSSIQNAFDRMRPKRTPAELATITVGDKTIRSVVGSGVPKKRDLGSTTLGALDTRSTKRRIHASPRPSIFGQHMRAFAAPGTHASQADGEDRAEEMTGVVENDQCSDEGAESEALQSRPPNSNDARDEEGDNPGVSTDQDIISEEEKKAAEEARVRQLIHDAEHAAMLPQENSSMSRLAKPSRDANNRDSTVRLVGSVDGSLSMIQRQMEKLQNTLDRHRSDSHEGDTGAAGVHVRETAEDRLSLTITKEDFERMRIIGQFNLGFILATRPQDDCSNILSEDTSTRDQNDELFIIDQHASDEKFNFERLHAETVVQNQRLVQPKPLDLTAVEEEVVIENQVALEKNGFIVEVDESGREPIGRRCRLVSLPLSKEVVFGLRDLEELIVLLSETPTASNSERGGYIPRPSKVRKMFAMRACRSSIMIGKTLTQKQMARVVRNMGTIDKPWNCPHGRPTMRHLVSLGGWREWGESCSITGGHGNGLGSWRRYFEKAEEDEEEDGEA